MKQRWTATCAACGSACPRPGSSMARTNRCCDAWNAPSRCWWSAARPCSGRAAADGCGHGLRQHHLAGRRPRRSTRSGCANAPHDYGVHISGRMYPALCDPGDLLCRGAQPPRADPEAVRRRTYSPKSMCWLRRPSAPACRRWPRPTSITARRAPSDVHGGFRQYAAVQLPRPAGGQRALRLRSQWLPIGLQIAGRPFAEARVLKVADAYQRDTDLHLRRPPILDSAGSQCRSAASMRQA